MRRTKLFMSGMMTVLTAVVLCLSMSACGGSSSDDDYDDGIDIDDNIDDDREVTRGTWQVDVSFSGNTSGWDLEIAFQSTDMSAKNYPMYEGDKKLELNAWDTYWMNHEFRDYSVKTGNKGYSIHCYVKLKRKNVDASPVTINIRSSVNGRTKYIKEFVSDPQYNTYYINLTTQKIFEARGFDE